MAELRFASQRISREFRHLDPRLHDILLDLTDSFWPDESKPARVVCIWRTEAENAADGAKTDIHCQPSPYRAADVGAHEFTSKQIAATAAALNARWQYDPARPSLLVCFTAPHGTGPHFHLQVHPATRRRTDA